MDAPAQTLGRQTVYDGLNRLVTAIWCVGLAGVETTCCVSKSSITLYEKEVLFLDGYFNDQVLRDPVICPTRVSL